MELRPAQVRLMQMVDGELASGKRRIVCYGPTGFGKSVLIEQFVRNAVSNGKRVAIVANRIHLVRALSERFMKSKIRHGIIQGGNTTASHADVIICSIQTVARRGLPHVDLIIIDEGHACAGSKDYRKVIHNNSNIPVLAFTATPFSKGMAKPQPELGNEPLFESLVVPTTIRELINEGFLVDCDIFAPSDPDLTGVRTTRNSFGEADYVDQDLAEAMDKPKLVGDIVSHWLKMSKLRPTVCFASSIGHSRHIVAEFTKAGVSARHIDCYMDQSEKDQILDDFKAGKFVVLSNVALIAEGFDYPECSVMILARPTKSLIRYIQMVGRVLRTHDTKDRALVLDHSGTAHQLGYPTDDLPLELCDGSPKKSSEGERKKKEKKEPKKCPQCTFMRKDHGQCPQCGWMPAPKVQRVEVVDGELKLLDRVSSKSSRGDKQRVYSQLLWIADERGYKSGWVAHQYKKIFGVWPKDLSDYMERPTKEVRNFVVGQMIRFAKSQEVRYAA